MVHFVANLQYMCHLGTFDDGRKQQKIHLDTFHFTFCYKVVFTWISPDELVMEKKLSLLI